MAARISTVEERLIGVEVTLKYERLNGSGFR